MASNSADDTIPVEHLTTNIPIHEDPTPSLSPISNTANSPPPTQTHNRRSRATTLSTAPHRSRKRRRLEHFTDNYLTLFNETHNHPIPLLDPEFEPDYYPDSQLGASRWSSLEKAHFFNALDRLGRHDLRGIAARIGSKSEVEVAAYLAALRNAERERQMFASVHRNVARAEVPAAVEVGGECEEMLEKEAEVLMGVQDRFDREVGAKRWGSEWIVDWEAAVRLDGVADEMEGVEDGKDGGGDHEDEGHRDVMDGTKKGEDTRHRLFYLSTFLELSELFFMNTSTRSAHDHWRDIAEQGQRPELTQDALVDLYNLVVSLTQRVLQVSIFMALSRIRALTRPDYTPTKQLTRDDVFTALDVLKMPADSWVFWAKLPRRNDMDVVSGSHSKGMSRHQAVALEDVEELLSTRHTRGRRRSMSVSTERSSSGLSGSADEPERGQEGEDGSAEEEAEDLEDEESDSSDSLELISSDSESSDEDIAEDAPDTADESRSTPRMTRKQRKEQLDEAQEEYMERLDQRSRAEEEARLYRLLRDDSEPPIKVEEVDLGPRPKTLRKDEEELRGWVCEYGSEWEQFGEAVPAHEFASMIRQSKEMTDAGVRP